MASIGDGLPTAASALASLGAAGAAVDNPHTSGQLLWTIYMGSVSISREPDLDGGKLTLRMGSLTVAARPL